MCATTLGLWRNSYDDMVTPNSYGFDEIGIDVLSEKPPVNTWKIYKMLLWTLDAVKWANASN